MVKALFAGASLLLIGAAAVQLRGGLEATMDKPYWMRLKNLGDVQYTGLMRVGGQQMKAIVDTGSFELLVFGKNCTLCGSSTNLYDGSKSPDYVSHGFPGSHSFGSGTTYSVEAHDKVQIGALHIPTQVFWEVTDADMPILSEDSFQVIMGVGPPSSVINFAKQEADEVHKELKEYKASGQKITSKVHAIVSHYDEEVVHAMNTTTVAENVGVQSMAVCLGKNSGADGYYIWNDPRSLEMPDKFVELDVVGDIYWSANMTGVQLGRAHLEDDASKAMKKAAKKKHIGCTDESCSAVIDTGTSLIVAPTEMAQQVFEAMQQWIEAGGTCDDLSQLPDLEFMLNGHPFTLPPEAYIGSMDGDLGADMKGFMPHLYQEHHRKLYDSVGCQPLIMTMDADSQFGPLWIIGMPFFRNYFTNFKFVKNMGKLSVPQATTMAFSKADAKCRPSKAPASDDNDSNAMLLAKASTRRNVQLRVDASKIRISSLAQRVQVQKGRDMLKKPTVHI
jgi:hypothetical protein